MNDKQTEKYRYDALADAKSKDKMKILSGDDFLSSLHLDMQEPYRCFKQKLDLHSISAKRVLEIGAGTGAVSKWLIAKNATVTLSDISPKSVQLLQKRFCNYSNFSVVAADMESLPFSEQSFDIVVSAGSLSYADNVVTMTEIFRVLRDGGKFICLDSLNHNPIYRVNRYMHYLCGRRTLSTLQRMPKIGMINCYGDTFGHAESSFFGSITWLFPLLRKLVGSRRSALIGHWCDQRFNVHRSAFKFVMVVTKRYGNK